jgi:hypothetical protein
MSATWTKVEELVVQGQTAWIQDLRKEVLLQVCEKYGLAVDDTNTVEEIRTVLRAFIKKNRKEVPTPSPKPQSGASFFPDPSPASPRESVHTPSRNPVAKSDSRQLEHQSATKMVEYLTLKEVRQMINVFDGSEPRRVDDLLQTIEYAINKVSPAHVPDVLELVMKTKIQGEAAMELRYKDINFFDRLKTNF